MYQIAVELTFSALSATKFENVQCSSDYLEVSQEAKVVHLSFAVVRFYHALCPKGEYKNCQKRHIFQGKF